MDGTTSVQRSHGHSSISGKRFSVTAKQDAMKHMLILRGLHDEAEKVDEMVRARKRGGWRDKLWLLTDVPESSKMAHYIYKFIMVTVFFSVVLFCMQTLPELQSYGESSAACRLIVNKECRKQEALYAKKSDLNKFRELYPACVNQTIPTGDDPYYDGCMEKKVSECMFPLRQDFVVSETQQHVLECKEHVWSCICDDTEFQPFKDHKKQYPLCKRPQCQLNGGKDLATSMQTAEIIFVTLFTVEFFLHLISARSFRKFWRSWSNIIDLLAIAPFYIEVGYSYASIGAVQMELTGGDPSILKMLRLLSVLRVFKMLRHLPQTQVLVMAAKESWRKLLLPLFFLAIFVVIFSAAMFELVKVLQNAFVD